MVDLNLASSYVPAFVCVTKGLFLCVLSLYLIPVGGLPALCALVLMDRVFLNSDFILDVNAAVFAVLCAFVTNHDRSQFGIRTPASYFVGGLWAVLASAQLIQPGTLRPRAELYAYALLTVLLSATHHAVEPLPQYLARTLGYHASVLVQVYWQLSVAQEEPLVLTLLRHGSVLVAPPLVALGATLVSCVAVAMKWKPPAPMERDDPDVEAAALREALASRKEKSGN